MLNWYKKESMPSSRTKSTNLCWNP